MQLIADIFLEGKLGDLKECKLSYVTAVVLKLLFNLI